ncbi:putative intracellular septation protein A [uncultured Pleomorphomonas sp.]|uniref:Inner membrane-spanning protein YciB n=1 Tax=uncultured Pleomorphomonas sp. TaxID=442121 RepID=A0A212LK39_9HYPH|nr:septation protein A [uncultured Pleomorphomonas sp.]SCM77902.1 putative intracellular septation protein A [uncultured Pleomorphomonas sp.]
MTDVPATGRKAENPWLKLGLELGPLLVFFFANGRFGIFIATGAFMAAMAMALVASWMINRRLAIMPLITGIVVAIFGTLTLVLHDDTFIKMKPTIVNSLFGGVLLGGLLFGKTLLGYVFDGAFHLDEAGWRKLTIRWGLFFFLLAVLNEAIWRTQTTEFWVAFKVWGIMPLTLLFSIAQLPLLSRHAVEQPVLPKDAA